MLPADGREFRSQDWPCIQYEFGESSASLPVWANPQPPLQYGCSAEPLFMLHLNLKQGSGAHQRGGVVWVGGVV